MLADKFLQNHLESQNTIEIKSLVLAEWNLNTPTNIYLTGNYRYRPAENFTLDSGSRSKYATINGSFDYTDEGNFYTGATDADVIVDGGYTPGSNGDVPISFVSKKQKDGMLFSLEDCFGKFRPRSGINKLRYLAGGFSHFSNPEMASRPRYYMADKDDKFKYWSSFRTEAGEERGIANKPINSMFYIDDVAPFIVYNKDISANRIIIKIQTNVGTSDLGPFSNGSESIADPFFGEANMTTPKRWRVQYLDSNSWQDAISFDEYSTREDGSPIFGPNGYLQLNYGLKIPSRYSSLFKYSGEIIDESLLPTVALEGQAFFVNPGDESIGEYFVRFGGAWESFIPEYGWYVGDEAVGQTTAFATKLVDPYKFWNNASSKYEYREFSSIRGLRIVVDSMNKQDSMFDLIELSPRLAADISSITSSYSLKKPASDLGVSGMPVGQLLASTGSIEIFDADNAFNINNPNSIIADYIVQNTQVKFYEIIKDVPVQDEVGQISGLYDYYVPVKAMYAEGFPSISDASRKVSITLRDMFFYFESITAPDILIRDVSLSYAVSTLLDYIGFSNYAFKRLDYEHDPVIPFFFIPPQTTVAQVLADLAVATQSAMFFDEFNNFIVMSKNYIMPSETDREVAINLYGNSVNTTKQPNIIEVASQNNSVYNDGVINYTTRYIQKSYGSLSESLSMLNEKTWEYKPVLLWEATPSEALRPQNGEVSQSSGYSLSAAPLNSDLSDEVPIVVNGKIINNTIDFGEGIYWINKNSGYFYANGEIIKYDAIEYSIPGVILEDSEDGASVWISSSEEFDKYFSMVPFNGKIYPTGRVRIYAEPYYEEIEGITKFKDGAVAKHGRCQFGTGTLDDNGNLVPVYHNAGLSSSWSDVENVRGCQMDSSYIFGNKKFEGNLSDEEAGNSYEDKKIAERSFRNGVVKNFLSTSYIPENEIGRMYSTESGTVQSSALVITGGNFYNAEKPMDHLSYVYKDLDNSYKHFGTRMRVIGRAENNPDSPQTAVGSTSYYTVADKMPNENITVSGASGGLAVLLNSENNSGYYFEIAALSENNIIDYQNEGIHDVIFYKVYPYADDSLESKTKAIPDVLWSGFAGIAVDDGSLVGSRRAVGEEITTTYDLAVEYVDIGSTRRFYLYLNDNLIATVTDADPLPEYNSIGLFVRGSARCMYENVYAITQNYSQNTGADVNLPANSIFTNGGVVTNNDSIRKYAISGIIKDTYLSGISSIEPSKHHIYYEEFGTIMREMAYFNIRYDLAYPALYAKMSPTSSTTQTYVVSGFVPTAYGAEFLIFNSTDATLLLDGTEGNYLKIQGVTFTQESNNDFTVDEYFNKTASLSDPKLSFGSIVTSPIKSSKDLQNIKGSRMTYGKNEFSIESQYIQSEDAANELMGWIISKVMKPRLSVGTKIFANPAIQLGDIVKIDHKTNNGSDAIIDESTRFVVYDMEYSRTAEGPDMTIYLSEVV